MADTILHVVDCLNIGGTERQLFELLRRLDRRRFRPLIACFKSGGELQPALEQLGLHPYVFPLRGSLVRANTARQITRMALLCKREKVRIVHAHDFYSNAIAIPAAVLAGAHPIASRRDLAHWLGRSQRLALRLACRLADGVVANASAVATQTAAEFGVPADRMHVIANGIDVAQFDVQARCRPDPLLPPAPASVPRVCMVASMHLPDKGHADLLEAAAILKGRGVRAQFLFISDGALRPELESRSRALGVADEVFFLGRRGDVPSVLARSDVLAHPSWAEGFPNAVLEAMCAARPVVATRVGVIPEVMQDRVHGLLIAPQRPAELASALEKLMKNPLAAHVMGLRGRQHVENRYSLEKMCTAIERLYETLVGGDLTYAPAPAVDAGAALA
jgi:glycosyltransferase involved in cell wall biosynthesis